jgi:hypothetical protein
VRTSAGTTVSLEEQGGAGGGLPSGTIVMILAGACPTGFTETSALAGRFLLGTSTANADIGTTGGADTISSIINHTHTVNVSDSGHTHVQNSHNHTQDAHTHTQDAHNHTQNAHSHGMAEGQTDGAGTFMDRSNAASATTAVTDVATATNQAATATNQSATATNQSTTATNQSATTGVTATTANPAGGVASFDNRPAFTRVIFCTAD